MTLIIIHHSDAFINLGTISLQIRKNCCPEEKQKQNKPTTLSKISLPVSKLGANSPTGPAQAAT